MMPITKRTIDLSLYTVDQLPLTKDEISLVEKFFGRKVEYIEVRDLIGLAISSISRSTYPTKELNNELTEWANHQGDMEIAERDC